MYEQAVQMLYHMHVEQGTLRKCNVCVGTLGKKRAVTQSSSEVKHGEYKTPRLDKSRKLTTGTAENEMVRHFSKIPAAWNLLKKKHLCYLYEALTNGFLYNRGKENHPIMGLTICSF